MPTTSSTSSGCDNRPFTSINVTPSYGNRTCSISWITNPIYTGDSYGVNVYKSRDGYTDWFLVNSTPLSSELPVFFDKTTYVDTNFKNHNQIFKWHYKLELVSIDNSTTTPTYTSMGYTSAFTYNYSLTEAEFSTLRSMIENGILQGDNIDAYLLRPKGTKNLSIMNTEVERSNSIDYLTQEVYGQSTDETGYGQALLCGYSNPIYITLTINKVATSLTDDTNGKGSYSTENIAFTSYSYPRFIKGDLIIIPETDSRYIFENYTEEYLFKGVFPFKFDGIMSLLPRNQIEYKIDLSEISNCCV